MTAKAAVLVWFTSPCGPIRQVAGYTTGFADRQRAVSGVPEFWSGEMQGRRVLPDGGVARGAAREKPHHRCGNCKRFWRCRPRLRRDGTWNPYDNLARLLQGQILIIGPAASAGFSVLPHFEWHGWSA